MTQFLSDDDGAQQFSPAIAEAHSRVVAVWQEYDSDRERIVARLFDQHTLAPIDSATRISTDEEHECHNPVVVQTADAVHALWIGQIDETTRTSDGEQVRRQAIRCSSLKSGGWSTPVSLVVEDSITHLSAGSNGDIACIAWAASSSTGDTVRIQFFTDGSWSEPVTVDHAIGSNSINRPAVAVSAEEASVAFDRYDAGGYSVDVATIDRGSLKVLQMSRGIDADHTSWHLRPAAAYDAQRRLWVTWLTIQDVVDEHGIVDQWPTVRGAVRSNETWILIAVETDNAGTLSDRSGIAPAGIDATYDIADLAWGLLSVRQAGVWGYLGDRRRPQIVISNTDGTPWLLWERKSEHDGPTRTTPGVLCGRPLEPPAGDGQNARAGEAIQLMTGPRGYVVTGSLSDGEPGRPSLMIAGRAEPSKSTERLVLGHVNDSAVRHAEPGVWSNWTRTDVQNICKPTRAVSYGGPGTGRQSGAQAGGSQGTHSENVPRGSDIYTDTAVGDGFESPVYWADLHVHTGFSADAEGYVDELAHYARDKAQIDVMVLQDNDHYNLSLTRSEYDAFLRLIDRYSTDGSLVILPGFEWTYYETSQAESRSDGPERAPSHRTVFGAGSRFPLLRNTEAGSDPLSTFGRFVDETGAIVQIHHQWFSLLPEGRDVNMEICSGWGNHFEDSKSRANYHRILSEGHRIGFAGGSDNHRRNPGAGGSLTGIFAASLNRASITDALRRHRCFMTDGARIVPRLRVAGGFVGDAVRCTGAPLVECVVEAGSEATAILFRDGLPVFERAVTDSRDAWSLSDDGASPGDHYYYLEIRTGTPHVPFPSNLAPATGGFAWTSPVWVTREADG